MYLHINMMMIFRSLVILVVMSSVLSDWAYAGPRFCITRLTQERTFNPETVSSDLREMVEATGIGMLEHNQFVSRLFTMAREERSFSKNELRYLGRYFNHNIFSFGPIALRQIMGFMAMTKHVDLRVYGVWEETIIPTIADAPPSQLVKLLGSISSLGIQPTQMFVRALETVLIPAMSDLSANELSRIMHSASIVNMRFSQDFLDAYGAATAAAIHTVSNFDMAQTLHAIAIMDIWEQASSVIEPLMARLATMENLTERTIRKLLFVAQFREHIHQDSSLREILPFRIEDVPMPKPSDPTTLEALVEVELMSREASYEKEYLTTANLRVDFYIADSNLIVEVDGPYHYYWTAEGEEIRKLADAAKDRLHRALGYEILRIDYRTVQ